MGKRKRPNYVQHRCIVCHRVSHRFFAVVHDKDAPKVCLCIRCNTMIDQQGWSLTVDKHDYVGLYLASLGYCFTYSGQIYHEGDH